MQALIAFLVTLACAATLYGIMRNSQFKRVHELDRKHQHERADLSRVYERKLAEALNQERKANQLRMSDLERHWSDRLDAQNKLGLSVVLYPFVGTTSESSLFSKQSKVEIGYKYQLLVQGLPCFEPHVVVVETEQHKVINEEMVDLLKSKALQFTEAAIAAKGSGGISTVFSIAKAAIQRVK